MFGGGTASASSFGSRTAWNMATMLKTNGISYDVQQHLVRVYSTLSACVVCAALGCLGVVALSPSLEATLEYAGWLSLLSVVASVGGTIWLQLEPVAHYAKRMAILMGVATATGVSLSALVALSLEVDPTLLLTAFLMTTTTFLCFTASACLAQRRAYLYLGGLLGSVVSMMLVMNLLNIFMRSALINDASLYVGLAVFCGYVIFDTQMIVEKASLGDKDSLRHALELFLDFVSIFVRILVILMKNADKKRSDNRKSRR